VSSETELGPAVTRRELLVATGRGAAAVGAAGLLASCGGGSTGTSSGAALSAGGGAPVRGGTFTVGVLGAGTSEQLYPDGVGGTADYCRIQQLYDNLFNISSDTSLHLLPALALSAEPNQDATSWIFKLRDGVHWHNGKAFTADDVVYTFTVAWSSPASFARPAMAPFVDFKRVRKLDKLTVEVPLLRPCAQFPTLFTFLSGATWILPEGSTPAELSRRPVGTGPFKFSSFTPGQQSIFDANREYWEENKPYVDRVVVNSAFGDNTALLNALLAGEINVMTPVSYSQAHQYQSSSQLRVLRSPGHTGNFTFMRVDSGPFADVRVRQAMKLLVDRQLMVQNVLYGFGSVGIDFSPQATNALQYAPDLPPATYDPERAKALLKAAGAEGLAASFDTSEINDTFVPSATLIAQQASKVGIKLKVNVIPTSTYYTPASGYAKRYLGQDVAGEASSLTAAYMAATWSGAPYGETYWGTQKPDGPATDKLLFDAVGATNPARAQPLWTQVQDLQVREGGYLNWAFGDVLDAVAPSVRGLRESPSWNLNNYRLLDGWLAGK
jgi:peptide/nickel transport system substrate-binding protein